MDKNIFSTTNPPATYFYQQFSRFRYSHHGPSIDLLSGRAIDVPKKRRKRKVFLINISDGWNFLKGSLKKKKENI